MKIVWRLIGGDDYSEEQCLKKDICPFFPPKYNIFEIFTFFYASHSPPSHSPPSQVVPIKCKLHRNTIWSLKYSQTRHLFSFLLFTFVEVYFGKIKCSHWTVIYLFQQVLYLACYRQTGPRETIGWTETALFFRCFSHSETACME